MSFSAQTRTLALNFRTDPDYHTLTDVLTYTLHPDFRPSLTMILTFTLSLNGMLTLNHCPAGLTAVGHRLHYGGHDVQGSVHFLHYGDGDDERAGDVINAGAGGGNDNDLSDDAGIDTDIGDGGAGSGVGEAQFQLHEEPEFNLFDV